MKSPVPLIKLIPFFSLLLLVATPEVYSSLFLYSYILPCVGSQWPQWELIYRLEYLQTTHRGTLLYFLQYETQWTGSDLLSVTYTAFKINSLVSYRLNFKFLDQEVFRSSCVLPFARVVLSQNMAPFYQSSKSPLLFYESQTMINQILKLTSLDSVPLRFPLFNWVQDFH